MPRSLARFADDWAAAERWLLPGECLACRERVGGDDALVCRLCCSRWQAVPWPQCERCGQPIDGGRACRICPDWPAALQSAASAVWLDDNARRVVHLLKYEGWHRVAEAMATRMTGLTQLRDRPVLVPIPLGASRQKARGYNQSAKIAVALAVRLGLAVGTDLLTRVRETPSQTSLTPDQRQANVRRAFRAKGQVPERIVLVDDVFTTGATLESAARALEEAGARTIRAVTFARAELPLAAIGRLV